MSLSTLHTNDCSTCIFLRRTLWSQRVQKHLSLSDIIHPPLPYSATPLSPYAFRFPTADFVTSFARRTLTYHARINEDKYTHVNK